MASNSGASNAAPGVPVVDQPSSRGLNLTHGLVDAVGRAVVVGDYADRAFPTEAELAKQYGVSRTVTREAVKMLAAKGMVNGRPRQGTFIEPERRWNLFDTDILRWLLDRELSVELLQQFNELRVAVEPQAAWLAARCARPAQVAGIRAALDRMREGERARDDPLEADIAFHVAVLQAARNPFYAQFKDVVSTALRASIRFTNDLSRSTADIDAHAEVYAAIAAGDPVRASATMQKLIGDVLVLILNYRRAAAPRSGDQAKLFAPGSEG